MVLLFSSVRVTTKEKHISVLEGQSFQDKKKKIRKMLYIVHVEIIKVKMKTLVQGGKNYTNQRNGLLS